MIKTLGNILLKTNRHWRSILLIYIIQLVFGFFVAIVAYLIFNNELGSSLELHRLADGFDRSVFSDMINRSPEIVGVILNRFSIGLLIFLVLSIFLHAGLLGNIKQEKFSISNFINSGKNYFIKFSGIAVVTILKMSVILLLIWKPFIKWMGDPLQTFHSDKTFILTMLSLVIFTVLLLIVIWLWSILARYTIIDGCDYLQSMMKAWKVLKVSFRKYFSIGVMVVLLHFLFTWLYTFIVDDWGASTWFCILGLVFIQQLFSLCRIWIRVFGYSLINE